MSHFATISTSFKERECLIKALEMVFGQGTVEIYDEEVEINGYQGKTEKAHIVVRQNNLGFRSYSDLGFIKKDGGYSVVFDDMSIRRLDRKAITRNYLQTWIGRHPNKYRMLSTSEGEIQIQVIGG